MGKVNIQNLAPESFERFELTNKSDRATWISEARKRLKAMREAIQKVAVIVREKDALNRELFQAGSKAAADVVNMEGYTTYLRHELEQAKRQGSAETSDGRKVVDVMREINAITDQCDNTPPLEHPLKPIEERPRDAVERIQQGGYTMTVDAADRTGHGHLFCEIIRNSTFERWSFRDDTDVLEHIKAALTAMSERGYAPQCIVSLSMPHAWQSKVQVVRTVDLIEAHAREEAIDVIRYGDQ